MAGGKRSEPVGSLDYDADDYVIWPCLECLPWHAEVVIDPAMTILVREWHAISCPRFQSELEGA